VREKDDREWVRHDAIKYTSPRKASMWGVFPNTVSVVRTEMVVIIYASIEHDACMRTGVGAGLYRDNR
jgi:hypothetical protein